MHREGYREVLQTWLRFRLASQLTWRLGDDIFFAGCKNLAALYELWLFFQLFQALGSIDEGLSRRSGQLLRRSSSGLVLSLITGQELGLRGSCRALGVPLCFSLTYNRTFPFIPVGSESGSWSRSLRPDYTVSIWPEDLNLRTAQDSGHVAHLHFDAKYRLDHAVDLFTTDPADLEDDELPTTASSYRAADLLKMHAYKDAIRHSIGSYVLYPGDCEVVRSESGGLLPSVGALPIRPGDDAQLESLSAFLTKILVEGAAFVLAE